jgi:hypothetical protein
MTLDTRFYILDAVDAHDVFVEGQRLLSLYDVDGRGSDRQVSSDRQDPTWRDGREFTELGNPWSIFNQLGRGLPAILDVSYRPGAPLRTPEQAAEHDDCDAYNEPGDPPCSETEHRPACWVEISWDTAYGYTGPDGMGCGDLHARFVAAMAAWCDERSLRWRWRNEFTGEVHDDLGSLIGLVGSGFEASVWLRSTVLPALAAEYPGLRGAE